MSGFSGLNNTAWSATTPTPTPTAGSFISASVAMQTTQIGKTGIFHCRLTVTDLGTATGRCKIPLAVNAVAGRAYPVSAVILAGAPSATPAIINYDLDNNISVTLGAVASGEVIDIGGTYEVA